MALDLESLEERILWEMPEGYVQSMLNCTADGEYICVGIFEDLSKRFRVDYLHGYIGFRETYEAHPHSMIVRIHTSDDSTETIWEENNWIGHVNTSPTQANLLTFCHEDPWELVDNRIWGMDINTGKVWKIRPCTGNETVGHEYWYLDGIHIGS